MFSQLDRLSLDVDGRYATDTELLFLQIYLQSARLRFSAYQKLHANEADIVRSVEQKLRSIDPTLLQHNGQDLTAKWKRDTLRLLRYVAAAMLINDDEAFNDQILLWFQTVMRSFKAERSCNATYVVMQDVVRQYLTAAESALVCPLLERTRTLLSQD